MPPHSPRGDRRFVGAALGSILGASLMGLFGGAVVWALGLPPCVQGGYSCGGLENAYVTAIGVLLGGYAGAVAGTGIILKANDAAGPLATAGVLAVLLPVGAAVGWGALGLGELGLLVPALLLPAMAVLARWIAVRLGPGAGRAVAITAVSILAATVVLILAAALSGRHCPFHPPPSCTGSDLAFYGGWVGSALFVSAVAAAGWDGTAAGRVARRVAVLLPIAAAFLIAASALTHVVVGLFLLPFAVASTLFAAHELARRAGGAT